MVAVLWFLELARAGCLTPAFAGENRLYLAHGRQRSLEGSWRGGTRNRGHDGGLRERCARGAPDGAARLLRSRERSPCPPPAPPGPSAARAERERPVQPRTATWASLESGKLVLAKLEPQLACFGSADLVQNSCKSPRRCRLQARPGSRGFGAAAPPKKAACAQHTAVPTVRATGRAAPAPGSRLQNQYTNT